jgi:hypothetical protein
VSTSKISDSSSVDHTVMQRTLLPFRRWLASAMDGLEGLARSKPAASYDRPRSYTAKSESEHRQGGGLRTLTRVTTARRAILL